MKQTTRNGKTNGSAALIVLLALVLVLPAPGLAEEGKPRVAFKAGAGAAFHTGQNFDPGFVYSAGLFADVSSRLGLEFLVRGDRVGMDEPPAGLGEGQMATTQFLVSGHYRLLRGKRVTPYGIFGVEFDFLHFWPAEGAEEASHDFVNRFAPHFGAGLDWSISRWLALNADLRYSVVTTWVEELPREGPIGEVNPEEVDLITLDALTVTVGLKFYF